MDAGLVHAACTLATAMSAKAATERNVEARMWDQRADGLRIRPEAEFKNAACLSNGATGKHAGAQCYASAFPVRVDGCPS